MFSVQPVGRTCFRILHYLGAFRAVPLPQTSPGSKLVWVPVGRPGTTWDELGFWNKGLQDERVTAWDDLGCKMLHLPRLGSRVRFASPAPIFSHQYNSLDRDGRAPPTPLLLRGSDRGSGMGERGCALSSREVRKADRYPRGLAWIRQCACICRTTPYDDGIIGGEDGVGDGVRRCV
jgi:hypothetical protein